MRALCLFSLDFFWGKAKENQNIYIKKYMKYITTAALTASETAFFLFFLKNKRKSEYYIRTNMESELFFIVDYVLGKGKVYEIHHNGYSYSYKYFFFFLNKKKIKHDQNIYAIKTLCFVFANQKTICL